VLAEAGAPPPAASLAASASSARATAASIASSRRCSTCTRSSPKMSRASSASSSAGPFARGEEFVVTTISARTGSSLVEHALHVLVLGDRDDPPMIRSKLKLSVSACMVTATPAGLWPASAMTVRRAPQDVEPPR